MASCVGSELTYQLSKENLAVFEEMLLDLERNTEQLGIYGYGISIAGLEEVFMRYVCSTKRCISRNSFFYYFRVDNINKRNDLSTSNRMKIN